MAKKIDYQEGKINFAKIITWFLSMPKYQNAKEDFVIATLAHNYPDMFKKEVCPNCGASMKMWVYMFDTLVAVLLCAMAVAVREKQRKGVDFTVANQVRVPELAATLAVKCRTTIASKLGLVAKVKGQNGKQVPGVWCITERGWAALRGERVPAQVRVWRKQIDERFDDTITLAEAFKVHRDKVEASIKRNKEPKNDYRSFADDYNPQEWVGFGGIHQGNLV